MSGEREEQFILRVQEPGLADKIRAILREDPAASKDPQLEIHFNGDGFHVHSQLQVQVVVKATTDGCDLKCLQRRVLGAVELLS